MNGTTVGSRTTLERVVVDHLPDGPGHVDAATELIEVLGCVHDGVRLRGVISNPPCVKQGRVLFEQRRMDDLLHPNAAHVVRIVDHVGVVVRDEEINTRAQMRTGSHNYGRGETLEPFEGVHPIGREPIASCAPRHERLKDASG
jgi:hypothetical protein